MRFLFAAFLLGHAAVHAVMWSLPFTPAVDEMPFDPGHSWLLGDARIAGAVMAASATAALALSAAAYLADATWWPTVLLGGAAVSLALMAIYFTRWWALGIVLSGALAFYAVQALAVA